MQTEIPMDIQFFIVWYKWGIAFIASLFFYMYWQKQTKQRMDDQSYMNIGGVILLYILFWIIWIMIFYFNW